MKRSLSENVTCQFTLLAFVVLLSRMPFLGAGFGAEEDSWLLALTAKNIALSGNYEMSRAPGHPLQEYLYAALYPPGLDPFIINLLSALSSVMATVFFGLAIRNLGIQHYLFAGFAFAFTPILFVSSTYTNDYLLAMAFVMSSFYFITKPTAGGSEHHPGRGKNLILAGILLGIATGFRITSAAMLVPFCIFLLPVSKKHLKQMAIFTGCTVCVGLLTYLPVLKTYGLSFFHYSDQFPYPNLPKVIYKATVGVFGLPGIIAIVCYKIHVLRSSIKNPLPPAAPKNILPASCAVILIYLIAYLRLPQKSAYLIPVIPFTILLFACYLQSLPFRILCILLTASSFFFSTNLTDPLRGSAHSPLAITFKTAGQEIFIDPLTGPAFSDYTKRLHKIKFTKEVLNKLSHEQNKIVLICGWWQNELMVRNWNTAENPNVAIVFYIDKSAIDKYISEGYNIYYLPEQNLYNDLFSQMNYTDLVAKPYM